VKDAMGYVFGAFSPVDLGSPTCLIKYDPSFMICLFTLISPRGLPPTAFYMNPDAPSSYVMCDPKRGPRVGSLSLDFSVPNVVSGYIYLGAEFVNDTGFEDRQLFNTSVKFQTREIEVFEVIR
jgi:hypothetical protein